MNAAPYNLTNGTMLYDAIEGNSYTVASGSVSVPVNATWGVVLLEQNKIDIPAMPVVTYTENSGPDLLSWPVVITDTTGARELALDYTIHSGTTSDFPPDPGNQIGAVTLPDFGAPNGVLTLTTTNPASGTYYQACAYNAAGRSSCGVSDPTAVTLVNTHSAPAFWPFGALLALITIAVGIAILTRTDFQSRNTPTR